MVVASIEPVGAVAIVAAVLIVLALVYFLVMTIVQLRKITAGLDGVIASVGEIIEKSAPVNDVVDNINAQLDAGVELLEGLLVQKAGMEDALGLVEGLYAGSASAGFRHFPESGTTRAPRIGEVYTKGTLTLARLGTRGPDRHGQSGRPGAAERRGGQPRCAPAVSRGSPIGAACAAALARDRHGRAGPVRAARRHRGAPQAAPRRQAAPERAQRKLNLERPETSYS